jgi:hypothetical protein
MTEAIDRLWDELLALKTQLGECELGESKLSVRAADLETVLKLADGHLLFCVRSPNAVTREAIRAGERGKVTRFAGVDEMLAAADKVQLKGGDGQ